MNTPYALIGTRCLGASWNKSRRPPFRLSLPQVEGAPDCERARHPADGRANTPSAVNPVCGENLLDH